MARDNRNPYPAPDATAEMVIQCEIDWLLERIDQEQRALSAHQNMINCFETRVHDLRIHLYRLLREGLNEHHVVLPEEKE